MADDFYSAEGCLGCSAVFIPWKDFRLIHVLFLFAIQVYITCLDGWPNRRSTSAMDLVLFYRANAFRFSLWVHTSFAGLSSCPVFCPHPLPSKNKFFQPQNLLFCSTLNSPLSRLLLIGIRRKTGVSPRLFIIPSSFHHFNLLLIKIFYIHRG